MSSSASSSAAGPVPLSPSKFVRIAKRAKLRNSTFIDPSTRTRIKRNFTLRNPANFDGSSARSPIDCALSDELPPTDQRSDFDIALENTRIFLVEAWQWLLTPLGRGIFKCSLAYVLASMATYLRPISNWLGTQDGKHVVATTVVYFHPARSAGSMIEADVYGVVAFLYFLFISVSSMAVSVVCESQFGLIELGYILVLVVFCGGGLGFVGWVKQHMNHPLVNVACSLTSLSIITVITKENAVQTAVFSNHKIVQVMKMVLMAICITTFINLTIFPVSARKQIRQTMIETTDIFGDMLNLITRSFLSGTESDLRSNFYQDATRSHKFVLTQLTKNLREAKAEHFVLGTESQHFHEVKLVSCMRRLSQAMGGLRSAAMTQFTLLKESENISPTTKDSIKRSIPHSYIASTTRSRSEPFAGLNPIHEVAEEHNDPGSASAPAAEGNGNSNGTLVPPPDTPAAIFATFIEHLGPSIKSLVFTLSQILDKLPFSEGPDYEITINDNFRNSLTDSIKLYSGARSDALQDLYKIKERLPDRSGDVEADFEEVAASCGYFSFCLQNFAEEMQEYLEILDDMKVASEKGSLRSWNWLKFWSGWRGAFQVDPERETLINRSVEPSMPKNLPDIQLKRRDEANMSATKTPSQSVYKKILKILRFMQRDDIRFAIKVGLGAAIWAMFAFIPETRPIYAHWRGEWGLLSFMLVCSMTIGASNTTGYARFLGTLMGAIASIIVWFICQQNAFALAFCGWFVSFGAFYYIVGTTQGPLGRFFLLTYNLSTLYAYSLSQKDVNHDDDDEGGANPIITIITLHRITAVIAGILWGLIVTRIAWPISARRKFKNGLVLLWLRMGLIWKRDPLSILLDEAESSNAYIELGEEVALQRHVAGLDNIRSSASNEFELRGPFPQKEFGRIMDSTHKMLDAFHAMNVVIQKDLKASEGEKALLLFTKNERVRLSARISYLYQVLASSLKLEFPITTDLPDTTTARDKLLQRIYQFRQEQLSKSERFNLASPHSQFMSHKPTIVNREIGASDENANGQQENGNDGGAGSARRTGAVVMVEGAVGPEGEGDSDVDGDEEEEGKIKTGIAKEEDYELLYAYALVTGQLAEEIQKVEREIRGLYGVLDERVLMLR